MFEWASETAIECEAFKHWRAINSHQDRHANRLRDWEYPWATTYADLQAGMSVLDVGSGYSGFHLSLVRHFGRGIELTLVDPAYHGSRQAGANVRVVAGSLPDLPFTSGRFDRVFCLSTLEHVGSEIAARGCRELARVVKPGGRLVLTVDYFVNLLEWRAARGSRPVPAWLPLEKNLSPRRLLSASGLKLIRHLPVTDFGAQADVVITKHHNGLLTTSWGLVAQRPLARADVGRERFMFAPTVIREGSRVGVGRAAIEPGAAHVRPTDRELLRGASVPAPIARAPWTVEALARAMDLDTEHARGLVSRLLACGVVLGATEYTTWASVNDDITARYASSTPSLEVEQAWKPTEPSSFC